MDTELRREGEIGIDLGEALGLRQRRNRPHRGRSVGFAREILGQEARPDAEDGVCVVSITPLLARAASRPRGMDGKR